jgi:hypothetical protein
MHIVIITLYYNIKPYLQMKRSVFHLGALAFQLGEKLFHLGEKKIYQLGEDFFIYHISFGRIILIHLVPLPLARKMSVAPCSPRGGEGRIWNRIFSS